LRNQVSGELDPLSLSIDLHLDLDAARSSRQVRMPRDGTLGRHAPKSSMDWRKKSQTLSSAAGGAAHDYSNINPSWHSRVEALKKVAVRCIPCVIDLDP
jgi:hypothetical protein